MEEIFYSEGDEVLEQVAQGICGCPIPGIVQELVEQPSLVEGVPTQDRQLETG